MTRSQAVFWATATAVILLSSSSTAAIAATLNDAQVLAVYIQVNSFDIDTALLGRAQGSSDTVRTLADHVASDHLGVRQAAYALGEKCNAHPTLPAERSSAAVEHDKVLAKLLTLKGPEFDRAYVQHEIAFHRAAIESVKTVLLPSAQCPALQAHLKAVLPAFEHHLKMTEALLGSTGNPQ